MLVRVSCQHIQRAQVFSWQIHHNCIKFGSRLGCDIATRPLDGEESKWSCPRMLLQHPTASCHSQLTYSPGSEWCGICTHTVTRRLLQHAVHEFDCCDYMLVTNADQHGVTRCLWSISFRSHNGLCQRLPALATYVAACYFQDRNISLQGIAWSCLMVHHWPDCSIEIHNSKWRNVLFFKILADCFTTLH